MPDERGRADAPAAAIRYDDDGRPPLDAGRLRAALLRPGSPWCEVSVVEEVTSTNAVLAERARSGAPGGLVLIAERQSAGRGRLGRSWQAAARSAVTMSVLVRPAGVPAAGWSWLPLLVGLGVAEAVRSTAGLPAAVKWPNDVLVRGRKLAGVLVERVDAGRRLPAAILGMGLNVSLTGAELPVATATSLALEGAATTDREAIVVSVLGRVSAALATWEAAHGSADDLRSAYAGACDTLGRRVRVELPEGSVCEGEAVGVDGHGRLLVRDGARVAAFAAGDVIHLGPAG
ncbi:MAG TPA: biotin--[acetyl-CoA-carboxylase] ligase [Nocardioidaceae bacterium]|nr:biotin--[acetyl-CoA-carboxylase] ligase [Nocardioidaceae bacterium]